MRIPMGNFGGVAAQSTPGVRAPASLDGGQAETLQRIGQQGQQIAGGMIEQEQREEKAARDAAVRAKTITLLTGKRDRLTDLADAIQQQVLDGSLSKDKAEAEYGKLSAKELEDIGADLPEDSRQIVLAELNSYALRGGNGVRKAVTQRNRQDVTAGINQTLEYLQRNYAADPEKAALQAEETVRELAPHSDMSPAAAGKLLQTWKEGAQYTTAFTALNAARRNVKTLDAFIDRIGDASVMPDLDPQKRAQLLTTADGYKTSLIVRAEQAAARAQREQEVRMRRAEAEFRAAQVRVEQGLADAPEQVAETVRALAGTPYQDTYRALQQQAREVGGFASMPIAQQRAALDRLNADIATNGATEAKLKQRDRLQKVVGGSEEAAQKEPLRGALERNVIDEIPPLDMSSVDGMLRSIGARVQAAETARTRWAGRPVSPLMSEEAEQLGKMLGAMPAPQRSSALARIAQALGPQASMGLAKQIDQQDRPLALALALSTSKTTAGRYTSELILKGQQAIKDKAVKVEGGAEYGWKAEIAKEVGDAFPNEEQRQATIEAAYYITAGLASEGSVDPKRAVRMAVSGSIVEHNGARIPLPAGVDEGQFRQHLRSLKPEELRRQAPDGKVRAGSAEIPLEQFAASLPGARLIYAGRGRYAVQAGGSIVTTTGGKPIVIGVGDAR